MFMNKSISVVVDNKTDINSQLPLAKCEKCGSTNLKDTGSFLVEIHKCQDCGELFCQDSGDAGWDT
jgi:hypothetical protein